MTATPWRIKPGRPIPRSRVTLGNCVDYGTVSPRRRDVGGQAGVYSGKGLVSARGTGISNAFKVIETNV